MAEKRMKIGSLLVAARLINTAQLDEALAAQAQSGGTLGEHLIRLGFVTEEAFLQALSGQAGLEHINLTRVEISPDVQKLIPEDLVRRRRVIPIGLEGARLVVGMVDPTDLVVLADIEFRTARTTKPVILSVRQLEEALAFFQEHGYGVVPLALRSVRAEQPRTDASLEGTVQSLLKVLVAWKGQALHLSAEAVPAIRVDNEIRRVGLPALSAAAVEALVLDVLTPEQRAGLEHRLEVDFTFTLEEVGRFRCHAYRQRRALAFTARRMAHVIPTAAELGLPEFLLEFALRRNGLILIAGPLGHGKTSTLACLVDHINRARGVNIITLEEPIEFVHQHKASNVNQREVGTDTPSYAEGLRHIVHQDPDVIAIGELRDPESFAAALSAAGTGHLVLATMRAMSSTAAADRIVDAFPSGRQHQIRAQLADTLLVVFAQRLVRGAAGEGCVLAWERMSASEGVRNAIREGKVHLLRGMMRANLEELTSIDATLADLVAAGKVTYDEALKHADDPVYLGELVKARPPTR